MIFKKSLFSKISRKSTFCNHNIFSNIVLVIFTAFLASACSSDSNDNNVAGGVTDIGNSVATTKIEGIVTNFNGTAVPSARVVAYYDNWEQTTATDSVVVSSDSNGKFTLSVDGAASIILFAESGEECGLAYASQDSSNTLILGSRRHIESSVSGESDGYMRIVGTNMTAKVAPDGTFAFEDVPPGDISLVYIRDDKPQGHLDFRTTDDRDSIYLPPMENRKEDGSFAPPDFGDGMFGVDFNHRNNHQGPSYVNITLSFEKNDPVMNYDMTPAYDNQYVEGISGRAIILKQGQFIDLGMIDPTKGDFTLSLWTKWDGPNGFDQVLFSQRAYRNDSTAKFQWYFDGAKGKFAVMKKMPDATESIYFDSTAISTVEWTFFALVSQSGNITMYVNDKAVTAKDSEGNSVSALPFTPGNATKAYPLHAGGNDIDNETWNGALDEIHVENRAQHF